MVDPTLKVYTDLFETYYIRETELFLAEEAQRILSDKGVYSYITYCIERIAQENSRVQTALHQQSAPKINASLNKVFVQSALETLKATFKLELEKLTTAETELNLGHLFELLSRILEGVSAMETIFETFVRQKGLSVIASLPEEADPNMILDQLLQVLFICN